MAGLHAVAAGSRDAATLLRVAAGRLGFANSAKLWGNSILVYTVICIPYYERMEHRSRPAEEFRINGRLLKADGSRFLQLASYLSGCRSTGELALERADQLMN